MKFKARLSYIKTKGPEDRKSPFGKGNKQDRLDDYDERRYNFDTNLQPGCDILCNALPCLCSTVGNTIEWMTTWWSPTLRRIITNGN
jgi:hypothetical protein